MTFEPSDGVHSRIRRLNTHHATELSLRGMEQCVLSFLVCAAHAPDVPREMPLRDEVRQCGLFDGRRQMIEVLSRARHGLDEVRWDDEVPQAQGRKDRL